MSSSQTPQRRKNFFRILFECLRRNELEFLFKKKNSRNANQISGIKGAKHEWKSFRGSRLSLLLLFFFSEVKPRSEKNNIACWKGKLPTTDVSIQQHRLHNHPTAEKNFPKIFTPNRLILCDSRLMVTEEHAKYWIRSFFASREKQRAGSVWKQNTFYQQAVICESFDDRAWKLLFSILLPTGKPIRIVQKMLWCLESA